MNRDYTLLLRTGPQQLSSKNNDCSVIATITDEAQEWSRNTLWMGGCDMGMFTVYGDPQKLLAYYEQWLGLDVLETDQGVKTWNGQIMKVELYSGSIGIGRDMSLMYNRSRAAWNFSLTLGEIDIDWDLWTNWQEVRGSTRRYGFREMEFSTPLYNKQDAERQVSFVLKMQGWPVRLSVANIRQEGEPSMLKCYVQGYQHSLNNRVAMPEEWRWSNTTKVSTAIKDIIQHSDYIKAESIYTNDHVLADEFGDHAHSGDLLEELLHLTDTNQRLYHGFIDNNREFYYQRADMTPQYYISGGHVYADSGATVQIAPRHIRPGVYRVVDFPGGGSDETSIFEDRRDVLIEDINIDASGKVAYKPKNSQVADYVAMRESNLWYQRLQNALAFYDELSSAAGGSSYTCTE